MIYLDSSALLKLLFDEPESELLAQWLAAQEALSLVSSELVRVEVVRAARGLSPQVVPTARRLLGQLDLIPLSADIVDSATEIGGRLLRSLDALHLASASALGPALTHVVVYDRRLAGAARDAQLPVIQPGSAR